MEHIFRKEDKDYGPKLNPVQDYIEQATNFFSAKFNINYTEARDVVVRSLKNFDIKNPIVKYRKKNEHEDMLPAEVPLTKYIEEAKKSKDIIAPSFTRYFHPNVRKSIQAKAIDKKIAQRSYHKKEMFAAEKREDIIKFNFHSDTQLFCKIFNNGLSGAYASISTFLYNPSAHFTLTSMTRSVSGIGNGLSESLVSGNKYFLTPDSVLNYFACVLTHGRIEYVGKICTKYNLHLPTAEEVMESILRVTKYYWNFPRLENYILETLKSFTPTQRAAILYINDLWDIKNYNDSFVRKFIGKLAEAKTEGYSDVLTDLDGKIDGINILAHHIFASELKGMDVNYKALLEDNNPIVYKLASTAKNIKDTLIEYKDFIDCFFLTDISPINIGYLKTMLRQDIVLSDTDSTCCSYDRWVEWYSGNVDVTDPNIGIAAAVMTVSTQLIEHHIEMLASNINTGERKKTKLAMKNEFFWPVFVNANVTKHYYATTYIREGNVFKKPKQEIKGVHLIASTVGGDITAQSNEMMDRITEEIVTNGKISLLSYVKEVADKEMKLLDDFKNGMCYMFTRDSIKKAESYKQEESKSKYINHIFWNDVLGDDYGVAPIPPYSIYNIPLKIKNKTDWGTYTTWLKDFNHGMYFRLLTYCNKYSKESIRTLRLPKIIADKQGIPKEFMDIVDIKTTILQALKAYYFILETIGFYRKPGYLVSEQIREQGL